MNFWTKLSRPFLILAPMEDVTDTVFRQIITACHKPDVFFTEFTSADGLQSRGRSHVIHRLQFSQTERPIVAQIWGMDPDNYFKSALEIVQMGFDGIDINLGCPERSVVAKGACAALIKNPQLAAEIISATKKGAGTLPVSVKTRIGYEHIQTRDWITFLLMQNLAALTIHGRTAKEMSHVPAHWDEIGKAVALRNALKKSTLIIGNGDVKSRTQALKLISDFGVDGVMIGRGIFENPWVFESVSLSHTPREKLQKFLEHINLFDLTWKGSKNFLMLRKFAKMYVNGFMGASSLRVKIMETKTLGELKTVIEEILLNLSTNSA